MRSGRKSVRISVGGLSDSHNEVVISKRSSKSLKVSSNASSVAVSEADWEGALESWLAPFFEVLGNIQRRPWAKLYMQGLMSSSERKSIEPMMAAIAPDGLSAEELKNRYYGLHHFIQGSNWDSTPLEKVLLEKANSMVGGKGSMLVIDDTPLLKQGKGSVGVARQYAGSVGKRANCQTLVSSTLCSGDISVAVGLELYLPKEWTDDPKRCKRAGVPPERIVHKTKIEIAIEEIKRLRENGVEFGLVTADAGYGCSSPFRKFLEEEGLRYAVGIQSHQLVYAEAAHSVMPRRKLYQRKPGSRMGTEPYRGGPHRVLPVASHKRHTVGDMLSSQKWKSVTWRTGTKGPLKASFKAQRVRIADGMEGLRRVHMPGEVVWLIGEKRANDVIKYYLTNHPESTPLKTIINDLKSRWACEQTHQQLKEELGLDHFEGRSWRGLKHHTLMTMMTFAFLQHLRISSISTGKREKKNSFSKAHSTTPTSHENTTSY